MSSRICLIADGESESVAGFRLLWSLIRPLSVETIKCLIVDSEYLEAPGRVQLLGGTQASPFAGEGGQPSVWSLLESGNCSDRRIGALLLKYHRRANAGEIRFSANYNQNVGMDGVLLASRESDIVVFGLPRGWNRRLPRMHPVLRALSLRGTRPVLLSQPSFSSIRRIVAVLHAHKNPNSVLHQVARWSDGLKIPWTAITLSQDNGRHGSCLKAVWGHFARLRTTVQGIECSEPMSQLSEKLLPTDLIVIGSHRRPWSLNLCLPSPVEELVRIAPCPMAIIPEQLAAAVANRPSLCDN